MIETLLTRLLEILILRNEEQQVLLPVYMVNTIWYKSMKQAKEIETNLRTTDVDVFRD